jgi:phage tail sheath gpL-like
MSAINPINLAPYDPNNYVPGVFGVLNTSQANTATQQQLTLIIGQMLPSGTYTPNMPVLATSLGDCQAGAGAGSMLANELWAYRQNDSFGQVVLLPVLDNPQGVAATGQAAITGTATAAGVLYLYIAGQRVAVGVNAGDTAATVATNAVAQCALIQSLPVSVAATSGNIAVTALHKGLEGNDITLMLNFKGVPAGEVTPPGIQVVFTAMANGALNPVIATALANIPATKAYDFIVSPYTDSTSTTAVTEFLNATTGRWSYLQQIFGAAWGAIRGNLSALTTFGGTLNDPHIQMMSFFGSPTPNWVWAAAYCGASAASLRANPAVPLNTNAILGVLAPPDQLLLDQSEQNTLLHTGLSTFDVDPAGVVHIQRSVTTYQTNAAGAPDNSLLNTERLYTIQFIWRDYINFLKSRFSQCIIVPDGTSIPFGAPMTTLQLIKLACIARYQTYCNAGLAQNPQYFAKNISGVNNGGGFVALGLPITASNQLEVIGLLFQLQPS